MYPDIHFEMTAHDTLQQNGKLERAIATIYSRSRAMLNAAGMPKWMREKLWAECVNLATMIDNVLPCYAMNYQASSWIGYYGSKNKPC